MNNQFKKICFLSLSQAVLMLTPDMLQAEEGDEDQIEFVDSDAEEGDPSEGINSTLIQGSGYGYSGYGNEYGYGYKHSFPSVEESVISNGGKIIHNASVRSDSKINGDTELSNGITLEFGNNSGLIEGKEVTTTGTTSIRTLNNAVVSIPIQLMMTNSISNVEAKGVKGKITFGTISGDNSTTLNFSGNGQFHITGDSNNFEGTINATDTRLKVWGSISKSIINLSGSSILSGTGSLGTVFVGNGSTLSPGSSPGSMSATHVTFNTGSKFNACLGIDASGNKGNSKVIATDSLTIDDNAEAYITMSNDSSKSNASFVFQSDQVTSSTILEGPSSGIRGNFSKVYVPKITGIEGWVYSKTTDGKLIIKAINYGDDVTVKPEDYAALNAEANRIQAINADDLGTTMEAADLGFQHITAPFNTNNDFSSSGVAMQDFVSRPKLVNYNNNAANFEQMLQAASESGPVSITTKQGNLEKRVWLTPMINKSAVSSRSDAAGSTGFAGGFLAGAELRGGKAIQWIVGMMTGYIGSKNTGKDNRDNYLKNTGIHTGLYNRVDYGDHWQHEIVASRIFFDNKLSRYDSPSGADPKIASAKYKSTQDTFNVQLNYLGSFITDKLTYRIDVGSTYTGIDKKGYSETGAGDSALGRNMTVGKSNSKAVDLYAGFGLRHIFDTFDSGKKVTTIRTTGVYEYATEVYKKSHNPTKITNALKSLEQSAKSDPASGKIRNKHIFQLNTSYLNRDVGVKFILGYEGIFYRNDKKARVQNHTGTLKMEYRW